MVSSRKISHNPLLTRNTDNSFLVFRCPDIKADVPANNTNIGAQKWVIQRVKNNCGVVVSMFVGESVDAAM